MLIIFNKPFGVLSQFRADDGNNYATLADYFTDKTLRVAGRLDAKSEGLLFLTDDGALNARLSKPYLGKNLLPEYGKTYWVQVAGTASPEQIAHLASGVVLKDGKTLPAIVRPLLPEECTQLWDAPNGIAKRRVSAWLAITLFEGKNRQIRRMTDAVGLPCLRLVRVAAKGFLVWGLAVGGWRRVG